MKAVFLDRDGVLNRDSKVFVKSPEELVILPGVPEAIARLNRAGFAAFVISNQSGLARGLFAESDLHAIHAKLIAAVQAAGGRFDGLYYCPHMPDAGCECRKPLPGLILRAAREHGVDLAASYMVGDKPLDVACGAAAGCRTLLVRTGLKPVEHPEELPTPPDHVAADLSAAADWIVARGAE